MHSSNLEKWGQKQRTAAEVFIHWAGSEQGRQRSHRTSIFTALIDLFEQYAK